LEESSAARLVLAATLVLELVPVLAELAELLQVSLAVQVALEQMLAELAPLPDYSVTLVVARPTAMPMLQLAPRMLRARARLVLETPLPA
jgi:hypothetical protein